MKFNTQIIKTSLIAFLIAFSFSFFFNSCETNPSKKIKEENVISTKERLENSDDFPEIEFDKNNHDFGEISEGDLAETEFVFTNVGKSDLIISDASGSCGCTVPDYPKNTPIKPGESGKIVVKFDSNNRPGLQRKAVTLITNTAKGKQILNIKSIVIPKS
ncbi:MAG: DUF1573 domain-containing protein [Flavobacteriaceae bacterium]|nr:DUF1573 domain-containing protein [Flavobacteriaceae bacterium]